MNKTNRQAYVFLDEGDIIQEGDEYQIDRGWKKHTSFGKLFENQCYTFVRRPIQPPSIQSDKPTVWDMYAVEVLKVMIPNSDSHIPTLVNGVKNITDAMMKARPAQ